MQFVFNAPCYVVPEIEQRYDDYYLNVTVGEYQTIEGKFVLNTALESCEYETKLYVQAGTNYEWIEVLPDAVYNDFEWITDVENVGVSGDFGDITASPSFTVYFDYGQFYEKSEIDYYAQGQGW